METPTFAAPAEALECSALFRGLPSEFRGQLAAHAQQVLFERGSRIIRQGEPGDTLYVVLTGSVKVLISAATGEQALVAILGPGDCLGELSLLDGEARSATVEAIDDVTVLSLSRQDFLAHLDAHPSTMRFLLNTLASRIRRTSELAADLAFLDVPGRIAKILLELADAHVQPGNEYQVIDLPLKQTDLAAMVGAARESVSKQLGWFEQIGAIRVKGRQITVLDRELLRRRMT